MGKQQAADGPTSEPGKKSRERTCAACRQTDAPDEMVRWVCGEAGDVVPDLLGKNFGRGAWLHPRPSCLNRLQSSLARSFKAPVQTTAEQGVELLRQAAANHVRKLAGALRRQNLCAVGGTAAKEAWVEGQAVGIVLASDALSVAREAWLTEAVAAGSVRVWGTKDEWGQLLGRAEVGVLAITEERLAKRVFGAIAMALLTPEAALGGKMNRSPDKRPASEVE